MSSLIDNGLYNEVKNILELARSRAYTAVNFAMVEAYWQIGQLIVHRQGGEERAEYGSSLINNLAERLTAEYGKGYTASNLKYMRQFYLQFQNRHALRDQLTLPIWNVLRSELKCLFPVTTAPTPLIIFLMSTHQ